MHGLRPWIILTWVSLPTVMYGGYALLKLLNRGNVLTPSQVTWFRAGHAHAGVLLLMSLLYYTFMDQVPLASAIKNTACAVLAVGIVAQSGGFFIQMASRESSVPSLGTRITAAGALLLVCAIAVLLYGLFVAR